MNDTQRLDSLAEHGLCVSGNSYLLDGVWSYSWVCHFGIDQQVEAPSIREAIDSAVETLTRGNEQ